MVQTHYSFIIVGSGFAGIAAAIALKAKNFHDFVILERASDIGGVWRDNSYPGAVCDVPSELYSYSFFPEPVFSSNFPSQAEIHAYIKRCFSHFQLESHLRLQTEVSKMQWNSREHHWEVSANDQTLSCQYLIHAMGALSEPAWPTNIPGFENFKGPKVHTAQWKGMSDWEGKNIAVIGAGASAVQIIPELQKTAKNLYVLQRTPAWVLPRPLEEHSSFTQNVFARFPFLLKWKRFVTYLRLEKNLLFFRHRTLNSIAEQSARTFLESEVADEKLRQQLAPNYSFGCKRVLLSNDYYQSLQAGKVRLLNTAKIGFSENHLIDEEDRQIPCDIIVCATGFETKNKSSYAMVFNEKNESLGLRWQKHGQQTFLGTMIAGYPNLFMLAGPRTGLGHSSMIYIIESQVDFVIDLITRARAKKIKALEPLDEAQALEQTRINGQLQNSVWGWENCRSWYQDTTGNASSLWPHFSFLFRRKLRKDHWKDFKLHF